MEYLFYIYTLILYLFFIFDKKRYKFQVHCKFCQNHLNLQLLELLAHSDQSFNQLDSRYN